MVIIVRQHKIGCSLGGKEHVDCRMYTVCTLSPEVYQSLIWQIEKQLALSEGY